jgi:hypothetical protein
MAEIKLSGNKKVSTLCKEFQEAFGGTLRVYNGRSLADENDTLSAIRKGAAKGGTLTVNGNMLVGNFEKKVKEMYGIRVQVANVDNSKLADNNVTLAAIGRNGDYKASAVIEGVTVYQNTDGSIDLSNNHYASTKEGLRDLASKVGMQVDTKWTGQQIGKRLIDFVNATENMERNESEQELKCDKEPKKHRYIIRVQGNMMRMTSIELPNASQKRLEEIFANEEPFANYVVYHDGELSRDVEDFLEGYEWGMDEEAADTLKELAGEVSLENLRHQGYYITEEDDHEFSLLDKDYKIICDDIAIEYSQDIELCLGCNLEENLGDLEGEEEKIVKLKALYKNNGYDDSYNLSFMDENCTFEKDKWYLVELSYMNGMTKDYILETDEEFDSKKLVCTHTVVSFDEYYSFLSGLFYDGKQLPEDGVGDEVDVDVSKCYVLHFKKDVDFGIDDSFPDLD